MYTFLITCFLTISIFLLLGHQADGLSCHQCVTSEDGQVKTAECLKLGKMATAKQCNTTEMNYCAKTTFLFRLKVSDTIEFEYRMMLRHCLHIPAQNFTVSHACLAMKSINFEEIGAKLPKNLAQKGNSKKRIDYDKNPMTRGLSDDDDDNEGSNSSSGRVSITVGGVVLTPEILNIRSCLCMDADCNNYPEYKTDPKDPCPDPSKGGDFQVQHSSALILWWFLQILWPLKVYLHDL